MQNQQIKIILQSAIAIVLSSLCYFFATSLHGLWILMWIAPLPILLFCLSHNKFSSMITAFFSYLFGSAGLLYFVNTILPMQGIIIATVLDAITFSIILLLTRWVTLNLRNWTAIFIFPVAWTTYEFISANNPGGGTYSSIAYTQTKFLHVIQIASFTGISGITFLLCLLPAGIATAWFLRQNKINAILCLLIPCVLLLSTLSFGFFKLQQVSSAKPLRVQLVAAPETLQELHSTNSQEVLKVLEKFMPSKTYSQPVDVVLFPEKIVRVLPAYQTQIFQYFSQIAKLRNAIMIAGVSQINETKKFNIALLYNQNGQLIDTYYKQHMLPGPESDITPGNKLSVFEIKDSLAGVAICKDMDFENPARQYGAKGVGILFVPALDFVLDGWQHARIAIMQGVANGYAVVRAAQWGLLTISDEHGRILRVAPTSDNYVLMIVGDVKPGKGRTFYSLYGDWFAILCGIILVLLIVMTFLFKKTIFRWIDVN